ncbi:MAG: cell division topological specificity factor MinE [Candidatus Velthaea sp.]|jgi:cell division topological specificity factor
MIEFFKRLFAPEQSGAVARERLRLVLLSDHLSLAPDVVESLRADLIAVISKYVEVDEKNCDVSFEQQDRAVAMLANIPILAMRERERERERTPPSAPPPAPPGGTPGTPDPPPRGDALGAAYQIAEKPKATGPSTATVRKRKRRRRAGNKAVPAAG